METNNTITAKWEKELQSLKNHILSLKLEGYEVWPNHFGFRQKTKFLLRDDEGNSLTGSLNYDQLNHFILGYGKALKKSANPLLLQALEECLFGLGIAHSTNPNKGFKKSIEQAKAAINQATN